MKNFIKSAAVLLSISLMPTSAFANYYTYQKCIAGGGNGFTCLGDLFTDDGGFNYNPEIERDFKFIEGQDQGLILETIKLNEAVCQKYKNKEQANCYRNALEEVMSAPEVGTRDNANDKVRLNRVESFQSGVGKFDAQDSGKTMAVQPGTLQISK